MPVVTQKRDPPVGNAHAGQIETAATPANLAERSVAPVHFNQLHGSA